MQSLWAEFESNTSDEHSSLWKDIKPLKDLVFKEINKISPLNDELFRVIIYKDRFENPFVDYLQKNFLPDEDVYKPKKKKDKPKGLELFYNEDSTDN